MECNNMLGNVLGVLQVNL